MNRKIVVVFNMHFETFSTTMNITKTAINDATDPAFWRNLLFKSSYSLISDSSFKS